MKIVILVLVGIWCATLMRSYWAHGAKFWAEYPISNQITGKFSEPFDIAFIGMAAAILLCPFTFQAAAWWVIALASISAAGCIGTMLSRRVWPNERIHITCAGLAFGGAGATFSGIGWTLHNWPLFIVACASMAPAIIELTLHLKPIHKWLSAFSRVEWLTAILITAWMVLAVVFLK